MASSANKKTSNPDDLEIPAEGCMGHSPGGTEDGHVRGNPIRWVGTPLQWGNIEDRRLALDAFFSLLGFTPLTSLEIPGKATGANALISAIKKHWRVYANMKRDETNIISSLIVKQKIPTITAPVITLVEWYRPNKMMDPDGLRAGPKLKAALDALQWTGRMNNDGWEMFSYGFVDLFYVDKKNPRVVVTFYKQRENV